MDEGKGMRNVATTSALVFQLLNDSGGGGGRPALSGARVKFSSTMRKLAQRKRTYLDTVEVIKFFLNVD